MAPPSYKFFVRRGPPQILTADNRRRPDRRRTWRGGRRDRDWIKRPLNTSRLLRLQHWLHSCRRWLTRLLGTVLARS